MSQIQVKSPEMVNFQLLAIEDDGEYSKKFANLEARI